MFAFLRNFSLIKMGRLTRISTDYLKLERRYISLLHNKAYVDGEWICAQSGNMFNVLSPASGGKVGTVPDMDADDVSHAINAAYGAFPNWSSLMAKDRSIMLRKFYNLLQDYKNEIAEVITLETSKPMTEAITEAEYGNSFIDWFAEEARRIYGDILQSPVENRELLVIKQPIGVICIITPWNFPYAMIARKVGAVPAAGCTCVIKPASDTPLAALAFCDLAQQAGIPDGVINVVTCSHTNVQSIGAILCKSPLIAGLSFTGSTETGKLLYQQCAATMKKVGLELGGNAPFIVFDSADVEKAIEGAFASKFRNSGQACTSANRFMIHECVFEEFVKGFKNKIESTLKLGDGTEPGVNQGPIINAEQFTKVQKIVDDALYKGATIVTGGEPAKNGNLFYKPTILTNITPEMLCYKSEIFGPIAVCIKFQTEEEVIKISNDTNYGLAGYFFSNDISQIWRVAKKLEIGMVGVNVGNISTAEIPFGGIKESGIGREGSRYGIDQFVYLKHICFGNLE